MSNNWNIITDFWCSDFYADSVLLSTVLDGARVVILNYIGLVCESCAWTWISNVSRDLRMIKSLDARLPWPMLTTEVKNGTWHYSTESRGSCFYHNPSLPPSISVGGSGKASDIMTQINIALGERGYFSPKSDKVCQSFFFSWL